MFAGTKRRIRRLARKFGYDIVPYSPCPPDLDSVYGDIHRAVREYTMTSRERVFTAIQSVEYVNRCDIPGALVECGVWRGGSVMAMAMAQLHYGRPDRDIFLYDTFEGMSQPSDKDVGVDEYDAVRRFAMDNTGPDSSDWCFSSLDDVQKNVFSTGYDHDRLRFVKGKVEVTVPGTMPDQIAVLRLDTDWYESTKHELVHMFPRLSRHGVLILDDYGFWEGCRQAVDEYLAESNIRIFLHRIDDSSRIGLKLD